MKNGLIMTLHPKPIGIYGSGTTQTSIGTETGNGATVEMGCPGKFVVLPTHQRDLIIHWSLPQVQPGSLICQPPAMLDLSLGAHNLQVHVVHLEKLV